MKTRLLIPCLAMASVLLIAQSPGNNDPDLVVLDGDNQIAEAGAINSNPFDIAVWQGMPMPNVPVVFSVLEGGGSLLDEATNIGVSTVTLTSDNEGTVLAYFIQPLTPDTMSIIQVTAGESSILLYSYNSVTAFIIGSISNAGGGDGGNGSGGGTGNGGNGSGSGGDGGNGSGNTNGNSSNGNGGSMSTSNNPAGFAIFQPVAN